MADPVTPVTPTTSEATPQTVVTTPAPELKFSQADLDRIIGERLTREKATLQSKIDEEKLRSTGQYEEIIKAKDTQLAALQAQIDQLTKVDGAAKKLVETQMGSQPDSVKELLKKLPVTDQIEWLASNAQSQASTTQPVQTTPASRIPKTPPQKESTVPTGDELIARKRKSDLYSAGL